MEYSSLILLLCGFILGIASNYIILLIAKRHKRKTSKRLLFAEIDRNLGMMKSVFERALTYLNDTDISVDFADDRHLLILAKQFLSLPFPPFSQKVFDSQLSSIGETFNLNELSIVFHYYEKQEVLNALASSLAYLQGEQEDQWVQVSRGRGFVPYAEGDGLSRKFSKLAPNLIAEYHTICDELIELGNPIEKKFLRG